MVARHLLDHLSPRAIAATGLVVVVAAAALLSTATSGSHFASGLLPGLVALGLGVGMVFVPVSVTSMTGIPASHAGVASGFLMTGHEVGAALGVAVLSAVASTAGSLTSATGAADAFSRGFIAAAAIAAVFAVFAVVRMPATRATGGSRRYAHALSPSPALPRSTRLPGRCLAGLPQPGNSAGVTDLRREHRGPRRTRAAHTSEAVRTMTTTPTNLGAPWQTPSSASGAAAPRTVALRPVAA